MGWIRFIVMGPDCQVTEVAVVRLSEGSVNEFAVDVLLADRETLDPDIETAGEDWPIVIEVSAEVPMVIVAAASMFTVPPATEAIMLI